MSRRQGLQRLTGWPVPEKDFSGWQWGSWLEGGGSRGPGASVGVDGHVATHERNRASCQQQRLYVTAALGGCKVLDDDDSAQGGGRHKKARQARPGAGAQQTAKRTPGCDPCPIPLQPYCVVSRRALKRNPLLYGARTIRLLGQNKKDGRRPRRRSAPTSAPPSSCPPLNVLLHQRPELHFPTQTPKARPSALRPSDR